MHSSKSLGGRGRGVPDTLSTNLVREVTAKISPTALSFHFLFTAFNGWYCNQSQSVEVMEDFLVNSRNVNNATALCSPADCDNKHMVSDSKREVLFHPNLKFVRASEH